MQDSPAISNDRARLAVFVSGSGRTLENLLARSASGTLDGDVVLVVASRGCRGAEIGREAGINTVVHEAAWEADELRDALDAAGLGERGWVVLAGYLKLLPIPMGYAGRVVNIHPSLLPRHGGGGMFGDKVHRAVLDSGDQACGCTVHLCDRGLDMGEVLEQSRCAVESTDTIRSLADRVFALEAELYPRVINGLIRGGYCDAVARAQTQASARS
jgi:phosphoribosylglycinamide formyltransferase-1